MAGQSYCRKTVRNCLRHRLTAGKTDETVSRVGENLTKLDETLTPVTAAENCATAETRKRLGKQT